MADRIEILPPFQEDARCPKCGGEAIKSRYRDGQEYEYSCLAPRRTEHIDRWCERCHFEWPEACAAPVVAGVAAPDTEGRGQA